ncbi:MAG: SdpI family protein [Chitinophagales bacterium]
METELYNAQIITNILYSLTSLVFIIIGFIQLKFPPKEINPLYGYRSKQAKSSEKKWHFAQQYSAKWMIWIGIVLLATCLPFFFLAISPLVLTISYISEMFLLMALMMVFTERKLKGIS